MLLAAPFEARLLNANAILIAGAGGGFDVYCGLPLFMALRARGKNVSLANLTFSNLSQTDAYVVAPGVFRVDSDTKTTSTYFPEGLLSTWFRKERGLEVPVYAFAKTGVENLVTSYRAVIEETGADTVVLIDGGVDALLTGDESSLGTPAEDALSMVAVGELDVSTKQLACVGFGTDARHGVCHAHVLENMQQLVRDGGFLGAVSLHPDDPAVQAYLQAFAWVAEKMGKDSVSYVSNAITASITGHFGELRAAHPTRDPPPWCNPLVALQWVYDLDKVLDRLQYRDLLLRTKTISEVNLLADGVHKSLRGKRPPYPMPI